MRRPPQGVRVVGGPEPGQAQPADEVAQRHHVGDGLHRPGHHLTRRPTTAEEEHRDEQQVAEGGGRSAARHHRAEGATDGDEAQQPGDEPGHDGERIVRSRDAVEEATDHQHDGAGDGAEDGTQGDLAADHRPRVEPGGAVAPRHAELTVRGEVGGQRHQAQ